MAVIHSNYINILETKRKMLDEVEILLNEIKVIYQKVDDSRFDFDSPAGMKFRSKAKEIIDEKVKFINNQLIPYINILNDASKEYEKVYLDVCNMMKGEEK